MVSIRYPSSPGGVDAGSIIDMFNGGFDRAKGLKDERDGLSAFGGYLDSVYGAQGRPQMLSDLGGMISPSQSQNAVQRAPLPDIATQRVAQAFGDAPSPANGYLSALRGAESSGNDAAQNTNSSATGRYQFTEGTWNDLMRQNPQLGLTADGRTDPEQQDRAIKVFTANNAKQLSRSGIPVNQSTMYAAHFLGAGGATNALSKPDQTPMAAVVDGQTLQANPFLQGMTVGDFKQWTAQKMGGQAAPTQVADASGQTGFSAPAPQSILPPRDVMLGLFKSKETRPFAIQLAQAAQGLRADANDPLAQIKYQTAVAQLQKIQQGDVPNGYRKSADGGLEAIPGGPADPDNPLNVKKTTPSNGITIGPDGTVQIGGGKLTEGQSKDVGYYTRGLAADDQLKTLDTQLSDFGQQNAGLIPLGIGNYLRTPEFQKAKQAADSFLTAVLRKDTGAAITKQEFEIYGPMFLPVPGDDQGVIDQKRVARQVALMAIRSGLGTAEAVAKANEVTLGLPAANPNNVKGGRVGDIARPTTEDEYNALPSGSLFIDPDDGKQYRKP